MGLLLAGGSKQSVGLYFVLFFEPTGNVLNAKRRPAHEIQDS